MTPTRPHNRKSSASHDTHAQVARSVVLLWFVLVGFALLCTIWVLINGVWSRDDHATQMLVFGGSLIVGLLTFVPMEYYFRTQGVAIRGTIGFILIIQLLLYVPAPTESILWVPDLPVYVLVASAVYWWISGLLLPLTYLMGKVVFARLARRTDVQRAWRQSRLIALYAVGLFGLFGLRAFIPLLIIPWTLMVVIIEVIFLSYIEPPITR